MTALPLPASRRRSPDGPAAVPPTPPLPGSHTRLLVTAEHRCLAQIVRAADLIHRSTSVPEPQVLRRPHFSLPAQRVLDGGIL